MATGANGLLEQLLALPAAERMEIIFRVWDSMTVEERLPTGQAAADLVAELERRDDELESGVVQPLTHQEVFGHNSPSCD